MTIVLHRGVLALHPSNSVPKLMVTLRYQPVHWYMTQCDTHASHKDFIKHSALAYHQKQTYPFILFSNEAIRTYSEPIQEQTHLQ